ncbi:MAG: DUF6922 domain-containing protein [Bacteroidales bacterium]
MEARSNNTSFMRSQYFWDVDLQQMNMETSKRLIIERVFSLGHTTDVFNLIRFYGEDMVIEVLKEVSYLDAKTLNFASLYFDLPLESFKCYRRKQSMQQHWNS